MIVISENNSSDQLSITDLMLKMLIQDFRFEKAMNDDQFRLLFNAFIIKIYSYSQNHDHNELQALEKDFLNVYENMEKYIKENNNDE